MVKSKNRLDYELLCENLKNINYKYYLANFDCGPLRVTTVTN